MTDQPQPIMPSESSHGSQPNFGVILPCDQSEFAKFISSLLGKPQTIEKVLLGAFSVNKDAVLDLFHLIDQRISQQNKANLVQSNIRILYDDDSSVMLNSIEDFGAYSEIKPLVSVGVVISLTYLIHFNGKPHPEKQTIDISFMTDGNDSNVLNIEDGIHIIKKFRKFGGSFVSFRISHTARSWGSDIESLLTGHIKELFYIDGWAKRFIWKNSDQFALFSGLTIFVGMLIGANFVATNFMSCQLSNIKSIVSMSSASQSMLSEKINYLIDMVAQGAWSRFMVGFNVYFAIALVLSIAAAVMIGITSNNSPKCFVLLSRKADEQKTDALKRRKRRWYYFVGSIILNITISVLSNILFSLYFEKSFRQDPIPAVNPYRTMPAESGAPTASHTAPVAPIS